MCSSKKTFQLKNTKTDELIGPVCVCPALLKLRANPEAAVSIFQLCINERKHNSIKIMWNLKKNI